MHDESNLRLKVHKNYVKKQKFGLNCYGAIDVFNRGLRIIENGKDFIGNEIIDEEVKGLSEDVIQK